MNQEQRDKIKEIRTIQRESGLQYNGATTRWVRYKAGKYTWEEACRKPKATIPYDACLLDCIMKEAEIGQGAARERFARFMRGNMKEDKLFLPFNADKRYRLLHFTYLGVKYYAKDVKRIAKCSINQARERVRKVRNYTMTPIKALEVLKKKKNPMCAGMQPRRSIDSIQLGTWEIKQLEAER